MITIDDIGKLVKNREVDLVLRAPPPGFVLHLHGEMDEEGDFFSLLFRDLEYVEMPRSFTVGELRLCADMRELVSLDSRWSRLVGFYSGPALAFRSSDGVDWNDDGERFVVIGGQFEVHQGADWQQASGG